MKDADYKLLCEKAADYYQMHAQYRYYHNFSHAANVLVQCGFLQSKDNPALDLAAIWHDAVYYPGSSGNESASAVALYYEARNINEHKNPIVEEAMSLIKGTTIDHHLTKKRVKGDQAVLLDADLSSLAADYLEFCFNQDNILKENFVEFSNVKVKRPMSAMFLAKFLTARKFIYHTKEARLKFEDIAKENITKYCTQYYPDFKSNLINSNITTGLEIGQSAIISKND